MSLKLSQKRDNEDYGSTQFLVIGERFSLPVFVFPCFDIFFPI